ncbi:sugar transporter [Sporothrix schenckii 1099-18]|uniref:Sugar transporter n=1 Tax=Sporothrix schenckii 1099-18 TaxID=1397361 RepID=A0A0F2M5I3_SPOSC|nr:sugar transporter [Sporothrix schenckii 1099-18]KJR84948.1 sugar transporter [Sporothrix schenckii 1099-18]
MSVFMSKASMRLHGCCIFFALGSLVWGYNIGIISAVLVHPGFINQLNHPDAAHKGVITAIYYLGTWTSYVFLSRVASDYLGRRYAALLGTFIVCVGSALQAGASGGGAYAMVIAGRIIAGVGVAIVSTGVPLYQSEIAPARQRGRFVVMNHIGMVGGLAAGFWVGYAMTFWDTPHGDAVGWRAALSVQFVPAVLFMLGLPFLPETPRWLVEHGQLARARASLDYFRQGLAHATPDATQHEFDEICADVAASRASGLDGTSLFREPSLRRRLWRAALLQFMAQMCGATAMKYYLPTLFKALGLGTRLSLLAGGIESTLKIGCTVLEMLIIDRVGRRITLTVGAAVMSVALLINGALPLAYPDNTNRAADYTCIVFIFVYSLGYSMGFGPAAWVYGSEIFPTSLRARGLNLSASGGAIGSIVVAQVWPVGIANLGSRIYFFFMAINIICVPIIWYLYPETKHLALEDMDALFGAVAMGHDHGHDHDHEHDHDRRGLGVGNGVGIGAASPSPEPPAEQIAVRADRDDAAKLVHADEES